MITKDEAFQKAKEHILGHDIGIEVVVPEEWVEDRGWCWVFYYNSRAIYETGNWRETLLGNAPIAVVKETGAMYVTGTAYPVEYFLVEIRQGRTSPIG